MTVTDLIEKLVRFLQNPRDNRRRYVVLDFIEKEEAEMIKSATELDTEGMLRMIELYGMKHTMLTHGAKSESKRGQISVTFDDFALIPMIVRNGNVSKAGKDSTGRNLLLWQATINGIRYFYTEEVRAYELVLKTIYKRKGI